MSSLQYDSLRPSEKLGYELRRAAILKQHNGRGIVDSDGNWFPNNRARLSALTAMVLGGRIYDACFRG